MNTRSKWYSSALQRWTLWDLSTSWLAVSIFLFIMHPSSFYDLWARYVYTPLYGPYSLSEALEGLIFYSLDESRDSISISSKRSLRHELVLELSNVVDDLQDYLLYFSSKFFISPFNLPDFINELRASYNGFEYLTVYWGALITRLVTARKIIEGNFWPHLFQLTIDNPADLRRLQHPPSFILPNASLDKLSMSASASAFTSTSTSPSHRDNTPCFLYYPLESQHLPFNAQSPPTMPSKSNPMGDEEDRVSSLRLDTMPTLSVSHHSRIPLDHQPSGTFLKPHLPQAYEDQPDEVFAVPKHTNATPHFRGSAPAHLTMRGIWGIQRTMRRLGRSTSRLRGRSKPQLRETTSPRCHVPICPPFN